MNDGVGRLCGPCRADVLFTQTEEVLQMRILITDNTWSMASLGRLMRNEGFFVSEAADAGDVIAHAEQGQYDAILIDPDLPDMEMPRLIRALRAVHPHMPICMVARRWTRCDRHRAYAAGADDVIGWPLDGAEVASRIRAYARRARGHAEQVLDLAGLRVDLDRRIAGFAGTWLRLTRLEYELVEMLALAGGRLVRRDDIMSKLYAWRNEPDPKIIDVYVCRIRARLAELGAPEGLIATSFGKGYRVDPSAMRTAADAA